MPEFTLAPTDTQSNIARLRWWARDHAASWGIGPVRLTLSYHMGVIIEDDSERIAVVPFRGSRTCGVFRFSDDERRYLGDLDIHAENPDELYDLLVCPRCGGSGVIETLERHGAFMVSDLLPCPECQRQESEPPLPF